MNLYVSLNEGSEISDIQRYRKDEEGGEDSDGLKTDSEFLGN